MKSYLIQRKQTEFMQVNRTLFSKYKQGVFIRAGAYVYKSRSLAEVYVYYSRSLVGAYVYYSRSLAEAYVYYSRSLAGAYVYYFIIFPAHKS